MKNAIIIGSSGQDGVLLNEYLKTKKYNIHLVSNSKNLKKNKINILKKKSLETLFNRVNSPEIYYLAAYHHSSGQNIDKNGLHSLFKNSFETHVTGLLNVLNIMVEKNNNSKLFYASSSLVFSGNFGRFQNEKTPYDPDGAYGISKATGNMIIKEYRKNYGLYCLSGILYNHESGLRNQKFLTRKIIESAIRISKGSEEKCKIGDLEALVDWGLAKDYVKIFHKILQLEYPEDFIIASGKMFKVKNFVMEVFKYFNLDWKDHVIESKSELFRKLNPKCGNIKKLKKYAKVPKYSISEFVYFLIKDVIKKNHSLKINERK